MNLCPLPLFRERFPFSTRSASADKRERFRKQAFRAIPAQPFAERREDCQLPGAIKVQLLRNCGNSFHERADAHERRLYLPRLGPARARSSDDPHKSEQRRKRRVVSQSVDVDVPRKSADDREHGRANDVADIGGVSFCGWLFCCATQSIPCFEGRYFRSPIGRNIKIEAKPPGFIASNGDSRHPTAEFRLTQYDFVSLLVKNEQDHAQDESEE